MYSGVPFDLKIRSQKLVFKHAPFLVSFELQNSQPELPSLEEIGVEHDASGRRFLSDEHREIVSKYSSYRAAFYKDDLFTPQPALSIRFVSKEDGAVFEVPIENRSRTKYFEYNASLPDWAIENRPKEDLMPGERHQGFFDLSTLLPDDMTVGEYEFTLGVMTTQVDGWKSEPISVSFEPLPDGASRINYESAAALILQDIDYDMLLADLPIDAAKAFSVYAFLGEYARGNPSGALLHLDRLPAHLEPLALAFRYEMAIGSGAFQEAGRLRHEIESEYPELVWRLEDADKGVGILAQAVRIKKGEPAWRVAYEEEWPSSITKPDDQDLGPGSASLVDESRPEDGFLITPLEYQNKESEDATSELLLPLDADAASDAEVGALADRDSQRKWPYIVAVSVLALSGIYWFARRG